MPGTEFVINAFEIVIWLDILFFIGASIWWTETRGSDF